MLSSVKYKSIFPSFFPKISLKLSFKVPRKKSIKPMNVFIFWQYIYKYMLKHLYIKIKIKVIKIYPENRNSLFNKLGRHTDILKITIAVEHTLQVSSYYRRLSRMMETFLRPWLSSFHSDSGIYSKCKESLWSPYNWTPVLTARKETYGPYMLKYLYFLKIHIL